MEAVPEPRPSEWDKRLSTHSPFRTLGINGQPLPSADGVSLPKTITCLQILDFAKPVSSGIEGNEIMKINKISVESTN